MNRTSSDRTGFSVLFVCLGNICRSPLAEGILRHLAEERGLDSALTIDSAGTGSWHVGEPPDPRAAEVAERRGIRLTSRARQVLRDDLSRFDLVLAMDRSNYSTLEEMLESHGGTAELRLVREYDPRADDDLEVPDPYYGGPRGFDEVFEMLERSLTALLDDLDLGGDTGGDLLDASGPAGLDSPTTAPPDEPRRDTPDER